MKPRDIIITLAMFQEYIIREQIPIKDVVERAAVSQAGVIVLVTRKTLLLSHLHGCIRDIELFAYFSQEMNLNYKFCSGLQEMATQNDSPSSASFGLIMDSVFWCLTVSIEVIKSPQKRHIEVKQLKLMNLNLTPSTLPLRFISNCTPNRLVVSQSSFSFIQVLPPPSQTDEFTFNKYSHLCPGKQGSQPLERLLLMISHTIFSLFKHYVIMFHQLNQDHHRNHVLLYSTAKGPSSNGNYAEQVLTLPEFEDQRLLSWVEVVPSEEDQLLESSFLLAFYQTTAGLEIVEVMFSDPGIVHRKFLYSGIVFQEFIRSSIIGKELSIKGVEHCLENHTVLIRSSVGIGQANSLTLLNLPSTSCPRVANQFFLPDPFFSLASSSSSVWVACLCSLVRIEMVPKSVIYHRFLRALQATSSSSRHLPQLLSQIQFLL